MKEASGSTASTEDKSSSSDKQIGDRLDMKKAIDR